MPTDSEDDWSAGTSPAYLRELVAYWRDGFDWRTEEAKLNRFHQFQAEVDGTRIHLIHERGRGPAPLPLILTHGHPDSFFRFHQVIPLLTDPGTNGGDPADAFDVVVPSLPGYAFSEPRTSAGGLFGFGDLWHTLMTETLGYEGSGPTGATGAAPSPSSWPAATPRR